MAVDLNLLRQLSEDRALASEILFAHRHPQASPWFHTVMVDLWRSRDEFVLFEAFREAGKTTKAEEHIVLEGGFGNFPYGLIIGETYSKACQRLEAIDKEARTNVKLHHAFGNKVLARKSIENRVWFASGAMLEAWGWEQELQSFKYGDYRPWLAYLDDIENMERVRDSVAVDAGMRKLWLELVPALDKTHRRIRFGQTRRAQDCMVTRLAANPEWLYFGVPICTGDIDDPATVSNWPARYPMEWIRAERDRYRSAGMLSEFLQSYMLEAVNPESRPFKEEQLRSVDMTPWQWMPRFVLYDPSRTSREQRTRTEKRSDRTGKVVVSRLGSSILVHESEGAYWKPDEFIADVYAANDKHSPAKVGIEKNSLDDWLLQPLRTEGLRRGVSLPLVGLQAPQDRSKEEFIMGLQPFAQAKDIVLVGGREAHPQLVAEWKNFPQGPRDVLNALAYSLRIFAGVPVYEDFSGANIGDAPSPSRGETVYVGVAADPSTLAAVAVLRDGRRLMVSADFVLAGALLDTCRTLAFELRACFPQAPLQVWAPADLHDQFQRIPLIPSLRAAKLSVYRGEHAAVARGTLSDRIRNQWRNARLLTVARTCRHTLNALSTAYAYPIDKGGRQGKDPEPGSSRLIAEALECMVATLDRTEETASGFPTGAHLDRNPNGVQYVSANPRHRS